MKKTILSIFFAISVAFSFAQADKHLAPDFTALTMEQDTVVLSEILALNKFVLLEFFYAENQFCQETSPFISDAYIDMGRNQNDVVFLSINVGNDNIELSNYIDSLHLENPVIAGIGGNGNSIDSSFNIQSYPTIILIGYDTLIHHDSTMVVDTIIGTDTTFVIEDIIINIDTIIGGDTTFIIDTTWAWDHNIYNYNIYENDIWPILSSNDIVAALNEYGLMGITDPFEKSEYIFNLYPNPSNGIINIQSPSLSGLYDYQVFDISGKIMYQNKVNIPNQQSVELNFSWLNRGIYFLRLNNGQSELIKKLIIH